MLAKSVNTASPKVCVFNVFLGNTFTLRFCIWSKGAIEKLDGLYGTGKKPSTEKKDFK